MLYVVASLLFQSNIRIEDLIKVADGVAGLHPKEKLNPLEGSFINYPATWPHVKKTHARTLCMMSFRVWTVKMLIMQVVHFGEEN